MTGATMFSTMDITLAYNQVPVAEKDIPKTAFVTKYGLYEFTKMPFGLSTAPQTYEHLIAHIIWPSVVIMSDLPRCFWILPQF